MTFSLPARAGRLFGVRRLLLEPGGGRPLRARARGVGAAASQNITDPRTRPAPARPARERRCTAARRSTQVVGPSAARRVPAAHVRRRGGPHGGLLGRAHARPRTRRAEGAGCVAAGNLLADDGRAGGDGRRVRASAEDAPRRPARRRARGGARRGRRGGAGALRRAAGRRRGRLAGRRPARRLGTASRSHELAGSGTLWRPQLDDYVRARARPDARPRATACRATGSGWRSRRAPRRSLGAHVGDPAPVGLGGQLDRLVGRARAARSRRSSRPRRRRRRARPP